MKRIDTYVLSEMIGPFIFGLGIFGSLWLANLLIRMVNLFVSKGVEIRAVMLIFLYSLPAVVVMSVPLASLLAVLLALGRLNADSEFTAMKACGVGFARILLPIAATGVIVSVLSFLFSDRVVPEANRRREYVYINEVVLKKPLPKIAKDIFFDGGDEFKIFVRNYQPRDERMVDITMYQFQKNNYPIITEAGEATIKDNVWTFRKGRILVLGAKEGKLREEIFFESWKYPIKTRHADRVRKVRASREGASISELYQEALKREKKGMDTRKLWSAIYFRTAYPFSNFFLVLIGAPLAVGSSRSGAGVGVGLSILIMFVYYIFIATGRAFGDAGYLPPLLGAWLANITAAIVAFFLMRRTMRS